jgi:hypothetical protein
MDPRLLDRAEAAAYCGVSINHFLAHVPVAPRLIGKKRLWDRAAIDKWLDAPATQADARPASEWLQLVRDDRPPQRRQGRPR